MNKYKWLPYKILKIYVIALVILAILGPIRYNFDFLFGLLMVIYILCFLLATRYGMSRVSQYHTNRLAGNKEKRTIVRIIKISVILTLMIKIGLVGSTVSMFGMPNVSGLMQAMTNAYNNLHHGDTGSNLFRQIDTFCTFTYYFSTFSGLYWHKKISKKYVFLIFTNILLDLFYNLFYIGTQRSLITVGILALVLMLVSSINYGLKIDKKKLRKIVLLVAVLAIFFINVLSSRKESWGGDSYWVNSKYDFDNLFLIFFSNDKTKYDVCRLISYLTQGFYGLTLAMQMPPQWTFFLGSARGVNSIVSQVFPFVPDFVDMTYPLRAGVEFGVDGLANWYTIFPWLASDFGWIGTLIYMGFVGRFFMKCWIQTIEYDNPIAFTMLVLLTIQYVFIVANNQLFIQRGESVATIVILLIYLLYAKRTNFTKISNNS